MIVLLLKTMRHKTSLVTLQGAIRASLDLVDQLASDMIDMSYQRNKIPSDNMLQSSNLLSNSMLPLLVDNNLSVGHGLDKSSSCEAIALNWPNSMSIIEIIPSWRLRCRS